VGGGGGGGGGMGEGGSDRANQKFIHFWMFYIAHAHCTVPVQTQATVI